MHDEDVGELAAPPAGAMVEALRGIGYSLPTAIADLIDNSISADARNVWITFWWDGADSWVAVHDDGHGMDELQLADAMRPGNRSPLEQRAPNDLGRFGLGLKTASFSQCRCVTVASRRAGDSVACRRWDLDYIAKSNEWRLLKSPVQGSEERLAGLTSATHGTVVLWERMDRVVGDVRRENTQAHNRYLEQVEEVVRHLGMVFHHYLSGVAPRLRVFVNGRSERERVLPWDPFLSDHPATIKTPVEVIRYAEQPLEVRGYVLPHKDKLTEPEYQQAAGPGGWNAQQGFYVYRSQRMLVAGNWLGLGLVRPWAKEEHYKLARIRVDLPNSMDLAWRIDVKKSTARPPEALRGRLRELADTVRRQAREIFVHRGRHCPRAGAQPIDRVWQPLNREDRVGYRVNRGHSLVCQVIENAGSLRADVEAMLRVLEETLPVQQIWLDTSERPDKHAGPFGAVDDQVTGVLQVVFRSLRQKGYSFEAAKRRLSTLEPFNGFPHLVAALTENEYHTLP